ncbi:hypothetical protein [Nostoc sp. NMS8]|uniref:hypothetical protein n=1 Tax=Nostoc sp. NMS8 TaxID=2815392 RepID=UPI0025D211F3|nr:hypothetical protein [Nostoc sp. NMS8]MBN3957655.1 hypothetical protein [Nostoc sp. NMS8]
MKTKYEREQLINTINVLLNQAYDSTLDEIYASLIKIEKEEEEEDLRAYYAAKSDVENNSLIAWGDIKKEIANEGKKDVA